MELTPYVLVVGSFAKGANNDNSDIDLYVKRRPQKELDDDWYGEVSEHYIDKVIEVFDKNKLVWGSLMIGYIHTNALPIQIEVSNLFKIHKDTPIKIINVLGVDMESAIDDKDLDFESTINCIEE